MDIIDNVPGPHHTHLALHNGHNIGGRIYQCFISGLVLMIYLTEFWARQERPLVFLGGKWLGMVEFWTIPDNGLGGVSRT